MAALGEMVYRRLTSHAATAALIGDRCYPQVLPQDPTLPGVVYEELPGDTSAGWGLILSSRLRVTAWAETKAQAIPVAEAVKVALRQHQDRAALPHLIGVMDDNSFDVFDPDTFLFGVTVDFTATLVL